MNLYLEKPLYPTRIEFSHSACLLNQKIKVFKNKSRNIPHCCTPVLVLVYLFLQRRLFLLTHTWESEPQLHFFLQIIYMHLHLLLPWFWRTAVTKAEHTNKKKKALEHSFWITNTLSQKIKHSNTHLYLVVTTQHILKAGFKKIS